MKTKTAVLIAAILGVATGICMAIPPTPSSDTAPLEVINYQGRLLDAAGNVVDHPVQIIVRLYDSQTATTPFYKYDMGAVKVKDGFYSFEFGGGQNLTKKLQPQQAWLELEIDGSELTPRERLASVPYALLSKEAKTLSGDVVHVVEGKLGIGMDKPARQVHVAGNGTVRIDRGVDSAGVMLVRTNAQDGVQQTYLLGVNADGNKSEFFISDMGTAVGGGSSKKLIIEGGTGHVGIGAPSDPSNVLTVEGEGNNVGGVNSPDVVARFRNKTAGNHTAVSVDAADGQDPVLYFSKNKDAIWGIRADVSDDDEYGVPTAGDRTEPCSLEIRRHYGDVNVTVLRLMSDARWRAQTEGEGGGTSTGDGENYCIRMSVKGDVFPTNDGMYDMGSTTRRWRQLFSSWDPNVHSDLSLKEDVQDLSYGLAEVMKLRPVSYRWIENGIADLGLIAQEVEPLVPEAVTRPKSEDDKWGMTYSDLIPVLIKAVQEQQAQIEELKQQVAVQK